LEVLGYIEPVRRLAPPGDLSQVSEVSPKVQVVDRPLLISHKDVEGEKVEWGNRLSTEHLEQVRKAVAVQIRRW
jgi:hypothetical protein